MKTISAITINRMLLGYTILLGSTMACLAPVLAHAQQFDIVGLKLGMTEPEVIAAIKAHDPTLKIESTQNTYSYSDGVQQFQTAPFLWRISTRQTANTSTVGGLIILFTPPPKGGRVWAIERKETISSNPPTAKQYATALKQKYGAPTIASSDESQLAWDFPAGKPNCVPRDPGRPAFPVLRPTQEVDVGFTLRMWQQKKVAPTDLSTCASRLHYLLSTSNGQVISSFQAIMYDVGIYAVADEAAKRDTQSLEGKARKARESKGQTPKL